MIYYDQLRLSLYQQIFFYFVTFSTSLILGWLFYNNILISVFVFPVLKPLKKVYQSYLIEKRKNILLLQFKDLLYSLASQVSVGRSLGQAMGESIIFWEGTYDDNDYIIQELKYMTARMRESRESDISVLENFAKRAPFEDIKDFVSACRICKETGGDMVRAISKTSDIIGDKISLEKEMKTMASQKKFEGRIVAAAPFLMVLCIKLFSPTYLMVLTATAEGRIITTIALGLIIYGWIIIERMNKIDF